MIVNQNRGLSGMLVALSAYTGNNNYIMLLCNGRIKTRIKT